VGDYRVEQTDDAGEAWSRAGPFLRSRPVEHNLALAILDQRRAHAEPGRYWSVVSEDGEVVGFALLSPLDFYALVTSLPAPAAPALVDAVATEIPALRGVNGEACAVAAFGGQWSERVGGTVAPLEAHRLYRLDRPPPAPERTGTLRPATGDDQELLVSWAQAFEIEIGLAFPGDIAEATRQRISAGGLWVWDGGGPVSAVGITAAIAGVSRIHFVYTPRELRRRGYASACVAAVSSQALDGEAQTCVLYAQLGNATATGVYRTLGYRGAMEVLVYEFGSKRT
jgi:predicted GNAT family acetyltransferase